MLQDKNLQQHYLASFFGHFIFLIAGASQQIALDDGCTWTACAFPR